MKGYAKFNVTQENRDKLKEWLDIRYDFIKQFDKENYKVKYKWFFGMLDGERYVLTKEKIKPPSGIMIWEGIPYKNRLTNELSSLYDLVRNKDEVFLGEEYARLFNRYCE